MVAHPLPLKFLCIKSPIMWTVEIPLRIEVPRPLQPPNIWLKTWKAGTTTVVSIVIRKVIVIMNISDSGLLTIIVTNTVNIRRIGVCMYTCKTTRKVPRMPAILAATWAIRFVAENPLTPEKEQRRTPLHTVLCRPLVKLADVLVVHPFVSMFSISVTVVIRKASRLQWTTVPTLFPLTFRLTTKVTTAGSSILTMVLSVVKSGAPTEVVPHLFRRDISPPTTRAFLRRTHPPAIK